MSRQTLYVLALIILAFGVPVVVAQTETTTAETTTITVTTTTATTTEVRIVIQNVTVFRFNVTSLIFGFANSTTLVVSYVCVYETDYTECTPLTVNIYNDTELVYQLSFADFGEMCTIESVCSGREYLDISNFSKIHVEVYSAETGQLLQAFDIPIPYAGPQLAGYLQLLYTLVTVGVLGGLAARGSTKTIGIGFVLFGIAMLLLPYIGIYPPYQYVLFVFAVIIGIVLLWFSER